MNKGVTSIGALIMVVILIAISAFASYYYFDLSDNLGSKTISIVFGSEDENSVSILNIGTEPIEFYELTVLVEGQEAEVINPEVLIEPGMSEG